MAETHRTALSDQLHALAHELDARADVLERAGITDAGITDTER